MKQAGEAIIKAGQEHHADAIGLSGLLVKSTLEMKYVIQDLQRQKLEFPVICGGAALPRKFVEDDLRGENANAGFYAGGGLAGRQWVGVLITHNGGGRSRLAVGAPGKGIRKAPPWG